jgi:glycosyltransferase involved in cell wall biosynthesis
MKVSIVIPSYNEKNTIEKIVEAVRDAASANL